MQPNEYSLKTVRTDHDEHHVQKMIERLQDETTARLVHYSLGIGTESGELQDAIKKYIAYGRVMDGVNIVEECGDLLWYIDRTLKRVGFTIEQAMAMNINKLEKRFPEKFSEENAVQRDLLTEREQLEKDFKPSANTHVIGE